MEEDEIYIEKLRCIVDQEKLNQRIIREGLTDDLLDRQVELNKRRHSMDIMDREEIVFKDDKTKREYVQ